MLRTVLFLALVLAPSCKRPPPTPMAEPLVTQNTPTQVPAAPVSDVPQVVRNRMENFARVYFELDAHALSDDAQAALKANAEIMQKVTDIKVEIQGHADERGTTDYNLALGQKRAASVKKYLLSLGVATDRITVVSFGEERPASSAGGEAAWSKNRRAEFRITWGSGASGTTN